MVYLTDSEILIGRTSQCSTIFLTYSHRKLLNLFALGSHLINLLGKCFVFIQCLCIRASDCIIGYLINHHTLSLWWKQQVCIILHVKELGLLNHIVTQKVNLDRIWLRWLIFFPSFYDIAKIYSKHRHMGHIITFNLLTINILVLIFLFFNLPSWSFP